MSGERLLIPGHGRLEGRAAAGVLTMRERTIRGVAHRRVYNSHARPVTEFEIRLDGEDLGCAASPQGETVGVHERGYDGASPERILHDLERDGLLFAPLDQRSFDAYLLSKSLDFGRGNTLALSLAFRQASTRQVNGSAATPGTPAATRSPSFPRLCLNVLNGGTHAYTNPVLSDFPEFLLVAATRDLDRVMADHQRIQEEVRRRLLACDRSVVNGNPVFVPGPSGNESCLDFLVELLEDLELRDSYSPMIDASAGDLWREERYRFGVTGGGEASSDEMVKYWRDLIERYDLRYLEDPFHEHDFGAWTRLTGSEDGCLVIGDNLYSSDAGRIRQGAERGLTDGTILKPDQAGTVTAFLEAVDVARTSGQTIIASHRSISTESVFLSTATVDRHIELMKIGPLNSDYSSVLRLNELIRAAERMQP
jgi:enolase